MAIDLTTNYAGLTLKNPLIVSACRLSENIENIKKMENAGAAAIVMYSIFEEEISYDDDFVDYFINTANTEKFAESLTYFPRLDDKESFLDQHLYKLKEAVSTVKIPIIGSLNAITQEGWIDYALKMQETGISALELNLYHLPIELTSSREIEKNRLAIINELRNKIRIPLIVKLSPFFTSIGNIVKTIDKNDLADAIVLFNRFYAPDIDIKSLAIVNNIELSTLYEIRLPLRWIAMLRKDIKCSLGGSTGVQNSDDVIKYILAGANAVLCASCLFKNGINYLENLLKGMEEWMVKKNYQSLHQITGLLNKAPHANLAELERAQYMHALRSYKWTN
jgi:dihydroorotate dehydrogenase (fumarate)